MIPFHFHMFLFYSVHLFISLFIFEISLLFMVFDVWFYFWVCITTSSCLMIFFFLSATGCSTFRVKTLSCNKSPFLLQFQPITLCLCILFFFLFLGIFILFYLVKILCNVLNYFHIFHVCHVFPCISMYFHVLSLWFFIYFFNVFAYIVFWGLIYSFWYP